MKTRTKTKQLKITKKTKSTKEKTRKQPKRKQTEVKVDQKSSKSSIPDTIVTDDGTVFYPCKNCCRAFAQQTDLNKHQVFCLNPVTYQESSQGNLPLASVENTMNGISSNSSTESSINQATSQNNQNLQQSPQNQDSELNNNQNKNEASSTSKSEDIAQDIKVHSLNSPSKSKDERILKLTGVVNGINTFDLKTKAKIAKILNGTLENNGFSITVMGNGDIVTKMYATNDHPQLEFVMRGFVEKETNLEKVQITLKRSGNVVNSPSTNLDINNGSNSYEIPEIPKLLESIFGEDELFKNLSTETKAKLKPNDDEVIIIDEEHFPTDDQVMSMADVDGTIVLEDLDIHICKQCGAVYHTLDDLVLHDKYDHRKIKKKFSLEEIEKYTVIFKNSVDNECPICLKKLKSKGSWPRHAQSHSEVGMFVCRICKKRFTRDDHRKNHEGRHVINVD